MRARPAQGSSGPFLQRGRRVQLLCLPAAIKLNCLALLSSPLPQKARVQIAVRMWLLMRQSCTVSSLLCWSRVKWERGVHPCGQQNLKISQLSLRESHEFLFITWLAVARHYTVNTHHFRRRQDQCKQKHYLLGIAFFIIISCRTFKVAYQ